MKTMQFPLCDTAHDAVLTIIFIAYAHLKLTPVSHAIMGAYVGRELRKWQLKAALSCAHHKLRLTPCPSGRELGS